MSTERHRLLVAVEARYAGSTGTAPLVVATQVARRPGGVCSFHAVMAEPRQLPLVIAENEIHGPSRGFELRASGLWADHVCETPDEHWSYGLEAFALAIDDPIELLGRGFGQRTPLGWEFDFEATDPPEATGPNSLRQRGIVHGVLLGPGRRLEIEGRALRGSSWDPDPDPGSAAGPVPGHQLGERVDLDPVAPDVATGAGITDSAPIDSTAIDSTAIDSTAIDSDVVTEVALPTPDGIWWVVRTGTGVRTRGW